MADVPREAAVEHWESLPGDDADCRKTPRPGAAWIICTAAAVIAARIRQMAVHRQWMIRSYAVTFTFKSSRVLDLVPAYLSHLGDLLSAVGVIAFTLGSILLVDIGLSWYELTTRRT